MNDPNHRLHPERMPGAQERVMREQIGDANYEAAVDHARHMQLADESQMWAQVDLIRAQASVRHAAAVAVYLLTAAVCIVVSVGVIAWVESL